MQSEGCMMNTQITTDEIKVEHLIRVPRGKVWEALTTPEGWTGWFSNGVQGRFAAGETLELDFGKWGKGLAHIAMFEPETQFGYRWHPGGTQLDGVAPDDEMTLVLFRLEDHAEGTMLTMTESGFSRIPADRRQKCFDDNTSGWAYEIEELVLWLEQGIRQAKASVEGD